MFGELADPNFLSEIFCRTPLKPKKAFKKIDFPATPPIKKCDVNSQCFPSSLKLVSIDLKPPV
jgi:hypothetical protein